MALFFNYLKGISQNTFNDKQDKNQPHHMFTYIFFPNNDEEKYPKIILKSDNNTVEKDLGQIVTVGGSDQTLQKNISVDTINTTALNTTTLEVSGNADINVTNFTCGGSDSSLTVNELNIDSIPSTWNLGTLNVKDKITIVDNNGAELMSISGTDKSIMVSQLKL